MLKTAKVKNVIPFVVFWNNLVHFWIKCIVQGYMLHFSEYDVGVKCKKDKRKLTKVDVCLRAAGSP